MRLVTVFLLTATLLILSGCARESKQAAPTSGGMANANTSSSTSSAPTTATTNTDTTNSRAKTTAESSYIGEPDEQRARFHKASARGQQTSLASADAARSAEVAMDRKVIRNANITIETETPADGQRKIVSIAESNGGFVVTSESSQRTLEGQTTPAMVVTVVARVPATQFGAVVDQIRGLGNRVRAEKITGQDVTEEYIDMEARIRTKKALEAQFLEIMKQAHRVSDALEVQSQLADVRTEIERLEGRRRFLENQSSLSTITVTLQPATPLVNASGFFYNLKRALGDGVDVAAGITLFLVRALIALVPIALLIFLPIGLLLRFLLRRAGRYRLARRLAHESPQPVAEAQ